MTSGGPTTGGSAGPMLFGGKSKLLAVIGDEVRSIYLMSSSSSQLCVCVLFFLRLGYRHWFSTGWNW